jgi:L-ornithine N5-oxygenase
MAHAAPVDDGNRLHDVVGVGFGPSNLALAIAIDEHNRGAAAGAAVSAVFLERQPRFGWHRGMLIEDATMQVSFLKDLVTLRNPASEFGFLSYLHSQDRLLDFINHKSLFPLRIEFHDYLEWAARKVEDAVHYGQEVVAVRPVVRDGVVAAFELVTASRSGHQSVHRARNLALGTGLQPTLPPGVVAGPRLWHTHDLLTRVGELHGASPSRFVVVGAGQSAAEAVAFLHTRFPEAEVCAVFSRYGYSPADDSSFANRIFDPAAVNEFYLSPRPVKQMILDYHRNTNYSVVDQDLIEDLYARAYQESVRGVRRLRLFNVCRMVEAVETEAGVRATVERMTTGERVLLDADVVVYATGYRPADPTPLLGELARLCRYDDEGRLRVERDYRVTTAEGLHGGIYLQGGTEHSHGISSSLLSNTAVRAGEILQSVVGRRNVRPAAPAQRDGCGAAGLADAAGPSPLLMQRLA